MRFILCFVLLLLHSGLALADEVCSPNYVRFDSKPEAIRLEAENNNNNNNSNIALYIKNIHESLQINWINLEAVIESEDGTWISIALPQNFVIEGDYAVAMISSEGNGDRDNIEYYLSARYGDLMCNPSISIRFRIDGSIIDQYEN